MCFLGGSVVNNLSANAGDMGSIPGPGRSLEKKMQPTPVFLSGEPHEQRSVVRYCPWGRKESNATQ